MRRRFAGLVVVVALISAAVAGTGTARPRQAVYALARAGAHRQALRGLPQNYLTVAGITVHYGAGDHAAAPWLLAELASLRGPVAELLGLEPPAQITAAVHPSQADLAAVFGWGASDGVRGVYASGLIRLLSPRAWVTAPTPADGPAYAAALRAYAPVAHELTHLILDYHTAGNYPAWLSEGLAQWVEAQLGSAHPAPRDLDWRRYTKPYTLTELDRGFDRLPGQAQAYRQSHQAVAWLAARGGPGSIQRLIGRLARGQTFDAALRDTYGLSQARLQESLLRGEKPTPGGSADDTR